MVVPLRHRPPDLTENDVYVHFENGVCGWFDKTELEIEQPVAESSGS